MPTADKPLPNNLDAERAVLATILSDSSTLAIVTEHLHSGDFFLDHHRRIFSCMLALKDAGQSVDQITICEALGAKGELEAAGGSGYILALTNTLLRLSAESLPSHAKIVREKAQLRQLIKASYKLQQLALAPDATLDVLQNELHGLSFEPSQPKIIGGNGHLDYSLTEFLAENFPVPEHLVEGLIPRNSTVLIVAMPHHLKSWFTTSLALACTRAGENILGRLKVAKPVRTYLVQMEDFPGQLQWRIRQLVKTSMFSDCDPDLVRILPRCQPPIVLPDRGSFQRLLHRIEEFQAEHVILDVVRRIFRGDINSPKDSALFVEEVDRLRETTGCTVTLVHHENRKEADIMYASAGSFNLPGWANVMIQFKRKTEEQGISHVEIEVDNKLAQSPEPMRMVLDLTSESPVRLEALEDLAGVAELREKLGPDWTVKDMAEALSVHKSNAQRRVTKMIKAGLVEKLTGGRRGRMGGLARFQFVGEG